MKNYYQRNFVEPYILSGAFRDSPLYIHSSYQIIENCLLSQVHIKNSTVKVESGVIHKLHISDNSTVILNGGLIKGEIIIFDKKSVLQLNRNSIIEANIYTTSPQQLQQKSGLLRGSIHIIVVANEDGTDKKQITVTSPRNSTPLHSPSRPSVSRPSSVHQGYAPSVHSSVRNAMEYESFFNISCDGT